MELATSFIEAINRKTLPQLKSSWQSIVDNSNKSAMKAALSCAEVGLSEFVRKFIPIETEDVAKRLKLIKEAALKTLREEAMGDEKPELEAEMLGILKTPIRNIKQDNFDQSKCTCIDLFTLLCRDFIDIDFNTEDEFQQAWTEVKLEYDSRARGPAKLEVWNTLVTERLIDASMTFAKRKTKLVTIETPKDEHCQNCRLW